MSKWVVHCKKEPFDVYIGRKTNQYPEEGGRWGNPFVIGEEGNRKEVIEKYRLWLKGKLDSPNLESPPTIQQIRNELQGKVLGCWCSPLPCHGDVLARIANRK